MKKYVKCFFNGLLSLSLLITSGLFAQNDLGKMDDEERIALRPMLMYSPDLSDQNRLTLRNKLAQIASNNGLAAAGAEQPFVLTAKAIITDKRIVESAPPVIVYTGTVSFYIVDNNEQVIFSQYSSNRRGVGNTESEALQNIIGQINPNDAALSAFVMRGKEKIITYYNTHCELLLEKANVLLLGENEVEGVEMLMNVPTVCRECYDRAMKRLNEHQEDQTIQEEEMEEAYEEMTDPLSNPEPEDPEMDQGSLEWIDQ